ncbi:hypothetical protein FACS1894111_08020 [Clostridia bacterium]|nr:hypothetical protein FACS1894111_08020 [Clostridia bacterium]
MKKSKKVGITVSLIAMLLFIGVVAPGAVSAVQGGQTVAVETPWVYTVV